jgi:N-acetylneuraminic acid mutarotase
MIRQCFRSEVFLRLTKNVNFFGGKKMKKNLCSICVLVSVLGLLTCSVQASAPDIQWTRIADLPGDQHGACAAVINGLVYMVGGQNPLGPPNYNKMRVYDPCTNLWSDGPSMPTRRYWPASGVLENCITGEKELYVVGGYSGFSGLPTVEKYTPSTGNWQSIPSITGNRGHGIMTAVVDNKLYAIGGFWNSGVYYSTNEMYDSCSNWVPKASMPIALQGGACAVWGDKIYVFGGSNTSALNTTLIYDSFSNSWSFGANIPRTRVYGGAVTFGDYIYLIGGAGCSNIIDVYDPVDDTWFSICNYPGTNTCSPIIAQSNDLVYVLADSYSQPGATECWVGQITEPSCSSFKTVDFSRSHNARMQDFDPTNAQYFPEGDVVLGCVPFSIPSGTNNIWQSNASPGSPDYVDITVNECGVAGVHTLINTHGGVSGGPYAWLEFFGTSCAYYKKGLYGDVDMRDYYYNWYTNNINGTTTTNVFTYGSGYQNEVRLDKQWIDLPSQFDTETLTSIRLTDTGAPSPGQYPFLAGVTVEVACEEWSFVHVDIKPTSCPNPLNVTSKGVLPVAILGTEDFDVNKIDVASIRLDGVAPIRSSLEDVAAPPEGPSCINDDCHEFTTDNNTVALWHLNGDGNDDSGNNYHLVVHPTNPNAVSWESGPYCDGHAVMGEDDWSGSCWNSTGAALTAPGSGCTYPGSGDWTVEAWVLFPSNSESYYAVSHYSKHWAGHDPYHVGVSTGQAFFQLEDSSNNLLYISADVSAYVGQWIHIAGVYRYGQDAALYVNGVQVAYQATTLVPEYLPGYDVFVGGCYCGTSTDLKVDEVRISDTVRYVYCHEEPNECECTTAGPDGYTDLTLKFNNQEIVSALGDVNDGDVLPLILNGLLYNETPIEGKDCIIVRGKAKSLHGADINKDGVVNMVDLAMVSEMWLQSAILED